MISYVHDMFAVIRMENIFEGNSAVYDELPSFAPYSSDHFTFFRTVEASDGFKYFTVKGFTVKGLNPGVAVDCVV